MSKPRFMDMDRYKNGYVRSERSDIRRTFARIRAERKAKAEEEARAAAEVQAQAERDAAEAKAKVRDMKRASK